MIRQIKLILLPAILLSGCAEKRHADENDSGIQTLKNQFNLARRKVSELQISYPDSAVKLLQSLANEPKFRNSPELLMQCYVSLAQTNCQYRKDFTDGRNYVDSANRLAEQNPELNYKFHFASGVCALADNNILKAEDELLQSIQNLPQDVDTLFLATLYNNISNIYYFQNNFKKALEYYQPVLQISGRRASTAMDALAFINAYCYTTRDTRDSLGFYYLNKAKAIAKKVNDSGLNAILYYNIAAYYEEHGQRDSALQNANKSLSYMEDAPAGTNHPEKNYLLIGSILVAQNLFESADSLIRIIQQTCDTAAFEIPDKKEILRLEHIIAKRKGNTMAALNSLEQQIALMNQVHEVELSDQLLNYERIKEQYAAEQKIAKKNQELKIQKFYNLILSLMALLVSLLGILGYFRWKKRKELIRKETELLLLRKEVDNKNQLLAERNRIAQEMHDDLGSTLTSTMIAVEMVNMNPGSTEGLKTINDNAHKLWQQINEVIWSLNMRNDSLQKLSNHLISYAKEFIQQTKLQFQFEESIETGNLEISGDKRRKIFLIVKELLNNVVRHAGAGKVLLRVEEKNGLLRICVEDDGVGFDPERSNDDGREHYGLSNLRKQITDLEGRLEISATKGTRVCFTIKID
jgi:signal transduction histidine kinase